MKRNKKDPNNWRPAVGIQISTFRKNENLTIEQLSETARVTPETLERIERGAYSKLTGYMLSRIAEALGLEVHVSLTNPRKPAQRKRAAVSV